jgi:CMP-N-acetylneuraminic acid synthetase
MTTSNSLCILIPFRFGNQEIKDKNLEIILKKSLFERSFNHAQELKKLMPGRICLSTNRPEILMTSVNSSKIFNESLLTKNISKSELSLSSLEIDLHHRSEELASKTAPISEVLRSVRELYIEKNVYFKYWLLLQPTTPFRSNTDFRFISNYCKQLENHTKEVSLVSVTPIDGFHPTRMYREKFGKLQHFLSSSPSNDQLRQDLEPLYIRDGAFYFFSDELAKSGKLKNDSPDFLIRNFPWNINIDTKQDLQLARSVEKNQVLDDPNINV